ncbi:MAG: hypothetical protein IKU65_04980 [Oscillospiraceae bacterium]|nr:hypothetical protein [Oscillospiraceae bacterium]
MEVLLKISAIAVLGVIVITLFRKNLPEMSVTATLTVQIALAVSAYGVLGTVLSYVRELAGEAGVGEELLTPLFGTVGISIIIKVTSDMCRDNGASSVASYVELIGGALAISYAVPIMKMIISGLR